MINFAIIGCGRIAQRHARYCAEFGRLLAVCDINADKANALSTLYNARVYDNAGELFKQEHEVNVAVICTPNGLHAEHSQDALRSGFHVLCEKPMSISVGDCKQMIALSEKTGKQLFIVKQNRFNPPVVAVKKLLDENKLGRIYSIQVNCYWNRDAAYYNDSWRGTKKLDGGILYTQFSHFIDLLYWMAGDVKEVLAYTANFSHQGIIEFEDTGVACFRLQNGALGSIHFTINSHKKNMEGSITIFAEKGTVKIGGQYLNELTYQQIEGQAIDQLPKGNEANDYGSYQGSMSNHRDIYRHVASVLAGSMENQFNGQDGLKTVEIIEKIYSAAYATH